MASNLYYISNISKCLCVKGSQNDTSAQNDNLVAEVLYKMTNYWLNRNPEYEETVLLVSSKVN